MEAGECQKRLELDGDRCDDALKEAELRLEPADWLGIMVREAELVLETPSEAALEGELVSDMLACFVDIKLDADPLEAGAVFVPPILDEGDDSDPALEVDVGIDGPAWPLDVDQGAKVERELRPGALLGPSDTDFGIAL